MCYHVGETRLGVVDSVISEMKNKINVRIYFAIQFCSKQSQHTVKISDFKSLCYRHHDKKDVGFLLQSFKLLHKDYHKDMRSRGDFSCMHKRIIETVECFISNARNMNAL